jgi:type II secretory pathway pseudopilin PulG
MTTTRTRTSRRSSYARSGAYGFTLVELMVSLVAGLIVTIAVVGLARTATTSFYEEARLSTVEGSVRSASERLRQDLVRTAYMSTGNLPLAGLDSPTPPPALAVPYGQRISHVSGASPSRYGAITQNLQGIRLNVNGSKVATDTTHGLATLNGLSPDELILTGNFTTDDAYRGKVVANTIVVRVFDTDGVTPSDPAVGRLIAGPDPDKAVRNAFAPGAQPSGVIYPALARVVDVRGCSHFVVLSAVAGTAAGATFTFAAASDGNPPILSPGMDAGGCGADLQEEVTINPVQIVHWYIGPTSVALRPDPAVDDYLDKFDLYREFRDATDAVIPTPGGPQVVAEYAIDLKFGITVDDPALPPPTNRRILDMDNAADVINIKNFTAAASGTASGGPGPQRVRSVRYRLATRAALPDRTANLTVPPGAPYIVRYCTDAACKHAARVRTIMSEVALTNQSRMTY